MQEYVKDLNEKLKTIERDSGGKGRSDYALRRQSSIGMQKKMLGILTKFDAPTHCANGHKHRTYNTYPGPDGTIICKECKWPPRETTNP